MNNLKQLTDDQLVEFYVKGNNLAFDTLLARNQQKLFSYIYYHVKDEDVANDLFQDTYLKVLVSIKSGEYRGSGKFNAWIMRIAHNLIMDYFRDKEQENSVSNDETNYGLLNNARLCDPTVEDKFLINQSLKDARMLMDALPQAQNQVVKMRLYQGLSFKEIADQLDISINTALGRMRYAVLNMRAMAQNHGIKLYGA